MNTDESMSGRVNVVLSDDLYELVKDLAEAEQRSQSQMTAILVKEALTARGNDSPKQTPYLWHQQRQSQARQGG
jgi:hypothetical protein